MIRLRLQSRLRRESERKMALWKELGKKAWSEDVTAACVADECRRLGELEEEMHVHRMAWHDVYSKIESLGREHEEKSGRLRAAIKEQQEGRKPFEEEKRDLEARKSEILDAIGGAAWEVDSIEGQIKGLDREARAVEGNPKIPDVEKASRLNKIQEKASLLTDRARVLQQKLPLLHEERRDLERRQAQAEARASEFSERIVAFEAEQAAENRAHERELREWLKSKQRIQDQIVEIQRLMEPLFESMGRTLDEKRIDQNELTLVYFQIDAVNRTVADIQGRIQKLQ
jgi:chromosome segregation ATPase